MSCAQREDQDNSREKVKDFEAAFAHLMELVAENARMLDAIIKHLEVPYKPPAGFIKE